MTWQEYQAEIRRDLAMMLEEQLRPVVEDIDSARRPWHVATEILDRAIAIVKGEEP